MAKYSNQHLVGLGKLERERLACLLAGTSVTISVQEAVELLDLPRHRVIQILAKLAQKGWLQRISRGVYLPVPLDSLDAEVVPEDPFVIAEKLFSPCYISGWSAVEHWGLTEQIFRSVVVMTSRQQQNYKPNIAGVDYRLHYVKDSAFFGLKNIWREDVKVKIADPSRTVIELMHNPALGGGIRMCVDVLRSYFSSEHKSVDLLTKYMAEISNGAAYKRLGFLLEKFFPTECMLIEACQAGITAGNAKLDVTLDCNSLVSKWRLWVPKSWKE